MTMPLMLLEGPDILIILALALLLFGGSRLAGVGRSAGRALREFKEETEQIPREKPQAAAGALPAASPVSPAGTVSPTGAIPPAA